MKTKELYFRKVWLSLVGLFLICYPWQSPAVNGNVLPTFPKILVPGDVGWSGGFYVNGTNESIARAVAIDGQRIYIGGDFSTLGNATANHIGLWNGTDWSSLGSGLDKEVFTIAVDGHGSIYAGGWFTFSGSKAVNHIARWNGQEWESLGSGIDGDVLAIILDNAGNVYAGGNFEMAGGVTVHNIAKWNGTAWSNLGEGIRNSYPRNGYVYALAIDKFGFIYAGGSFDHAGGSQANNIARWDGHQWSEVAGGITGDPYFTAVYALAADARGNLYCGGQFSIAGGIDAENIARWNGDTWSGVGGGVQSGETFKAAVKTIIVDGSVIYISGNLSSANGTLLGGIAKWDGFYWDNLQGGAWKENGTPYFSDMAMDRDGNIIAVGLFTLAGGNCANNIALWDGTSWGGLGNETSLDGPVYSMLPDINGGFYAGGAFICAGGMVVNHIAHWDGTAWSGLGDGVSVGDYSASVQALAIDRNGNLYAGGNFTRAGGLEAYNIAKWNGDSWEVLGDALNYSIKALILDPQGHLYVGGNFTSDGKKPLAYIAQWDGQHWESLGSGMDRPVSTLNIDPLGNLIAGGYFYEAGGVPAEGIARWNGQVWEAVIDHSIDNPNIIILDGNTIYGGGQQIWKIENGNFTVIGGGLSNYPEKSLVYALTLDEKKRLVVGGSFNKAGAINVNNIARWDGTQWNNLGGGIEGGDVYCTFIYSSDRLLVGGWFNQAGSRASQNLAAWLEPFFFWLPNISR
jgi:trimeric autotransporter adhesin